MKSVLYGSALLLVCAVEAVALPSFRSANGVPAELSQPAISGPLATGTLSERLNFSSLQLRDLAKNAVQALLPGGKSLLVQGMPQVPIAVHSFALPAGKEGRVVLENLKMEQSNASVNLPKTPVSGVWGPQSLKLGGPKVGR